VFLCTSASDSSSGERSGVPWSGLWTVSVGVAADIVDIDDSTVERFAFFLLSCNSFHQKTTKGATYLKLHTNHYQVPNSIILKSLDLLEELELFAQRIQCCPFCFIDCCLNFNRFPLVYPLYFLICQSTSFFSNT
jgi:hypothetical protein